MARYTAVALDFRLTHLYSVLARTNNRKRTDRIYSSHKLREETGMKENKDHNKHTKARRKLLKTSIVGAGAVIAGKSLPEQWARPVVESITLPAHAQTSLLSAGGPLLLSVTAIDDSIIDLLVPTAQAQYDASVVTSELCFDLNSNGTVNVRALVDIVDGCVHDIAYFTGTVNQGVETVLDFLNGPCFSDGNKAAWVTVTMADGVASGDFVCVTIETQEYASAFNLSDPVCPIGATPDPCDQNTCYVIYD